MLDLLSGDMYPLIKEPGWHAFIPDWSPDGKMLAFSAYPVPRYSEGFPRVFLASLLERQVKQITQGEHLEVRPFFSPDGKTLAFRRGWDIWLYSLADGSERQLLSDNYCYELHFGCFSPDGKRIVTLGPINVPYIVDTATGAKQTLTDGNHHDLCLSWSPSGNAIGFVRDREQAVIIELDGTIIQKTTLKNERILAGLHSGVQWARKAEVLTFLDGYGNAWVAGPEKPPIQVTHFPEQPKVKQEPKQVEYPSTGGVNVPALLLEPENFVPGKSPAVVFVHGGPASEAAVHLVKPPWTCYLNALLEAGFLVLLPNYRGSNGVSLEWTIVTSEQRGVVDVDDVMAAKTFLQASGLASPDRVAAVGPSYGGYLTLMALARSSQEWVCAASLWGMWDPVNLRIAWVVDNGELPDLADRTPNNLLNKMHSPLLAIHGAHDTMSTVDEVNRASEVLQSNGTPCEVHIYEDVHGLPLYTDEAAEVLVAFLKKHMT